MSNEMLTITINWKDETNKGKLTSIKDYIIYEDTFIANTNNNHQVVLGKDLKYGYCIHPFSGTGKVTEEGRNPCKHIWELREIIERETGVGMYNWISINSIVEFLSKEGIEITSKDEYGVFFGKHHLDVYSMKNGEIDYESSPEVKVEEFKDILASVFDQKWEEKWKEFQEGKK